MLPPKEQSFHVKITGNRTKEVYEGSFTVKAYLTNSELIDVGLRLDNYNRGSVTVPDGIAMLNRSIAELEVRVLKAPSWWKDSDHGRNLYDQNVVITVFNKVLDAEDSYGKKIEEVATVAERDNEAATGSRSKSSKATG